ncbi:MAG: hypothetical protein ACK5AN_06075 [Planctomyces sp.]|jgi:hypothetical protein
MIAPSRPLFSLGRTVATPGAVEWLQQADVDAALLLSCYNIEGTRVYVITEADRSSTCILLASEY